MSETDSTDTATAQRGLCVSTLLQFPSVSFISFIRSSGPEDICEDISDHVEQIHALLETEFSLKLLSYSVSIIVDIRAVQLLWHQLRVSVLVLKERLLQSLQDPNGNYTRHTDILQAFSQDHDQARLDSLTEVDDSGQLTIKCSQDYFSLDCGITAYELSDYSPGEEAQVRESSQEPRTLYPELQHSFPQLLCSVDLLTIAASIQNQQSSPLEEPDTPTQEPVEPCSGSELTEARVQGEGPERPEQGARGNTPSPTRPSLAKKPMFAAGEARLVGPASLPYQADISRSTPSLLELPDRSKFWLELESAYPANGSQSDENLHAMNRKNLQANEQTPAGGNRGKIPLYRSSSEASQEHRAGRHTLQTGSATSRSDAMQATGDSSSPLPSSGEEPSDLDVREDSTSPEDLPLPLEASVSARPAHSPGGECWYGSDEFLALPAQLRQTELLALKLENLAQSLPPRAPHQPPIQDVDDWELTEASSEWEGSPHSPPPLPTQPYRKGPRGRRFSSSSSDVAASLEGSIESGPLSDLLSEDEGGWSSSEHHQRSVPRAEKPEACRMVMECTPLIQQLLEDIRHQQNYQDIWGKIEVCVCACVCASMCVCLAAWARLRQAAAST
ncbi:A-kinase anchor protein 6-like isoform X2 [Brachyhypopomus gauderio]|uniref:A-kinase anchor protein 6-like isoform X2 n=1 Tax=Brachyhypopomus gauderio TaxID=698409 RepID=UPI004043544F